MDNSDLIGFEFQDADGWPAVVTGPVSWGTDTYMNVRVTKAYPEVEETCRATSLLRQAKMQQDLVRAEDGDEGVDDGGVAGVGTNES